MKLLFSILSLLISIVGYSQVITTNPAFPKADSSVVITFDATKGNGALAGYSGTVYAHTGVITSASTSPSDWKYVQGSWATANAPIMSSLGNDKYTLSMASIRSFYGVPSNETILKMAFVFRDLSGNTVGRASDGGDIFVDVFQSGLSVGVISPDHNSIQTADTVLISCESSELATLKLFVNGSLIDSAANATSINTNYNASVTGNYEIIIMADNGSTVAYDTSYFVVNPDISLEAVPTGLKLGINYISESEVTFVLAAPYKNFIYVLGDFNNWQLNTDYFMKKDPDGNRWWLSVSGLTAGDKYGFQYFIDGSLKIADPLSETVLDPYNDGFIPTSTYPNLHPYPNAKTTGMVSVIHMDKPAFNWTATNYTLPKERDLVIYELLTRDFIAKHDFQTLLDTLDYLENLGINAIELMPVNEFEGNESWGYNPSYHMALDKYYGTPTAFKNFIDECHKRNIAVILDVVYNHAFSQSPLCQMYWDAANFKPSNNNPFLNPDARHDFNVGYDFNHDSPLFREFLKTVMQYWLAEYNVDGFRFDLSKGFTQTNTLGNVNAFAQYDQSRIDNLNRIYIECKSINPDAYLILEHFANNDEETALVNRGFMIWGNMNHEFAEAAMGYSSNLQGASHTSRNWNHMRLIGYAESHDEERLMFKCKSFGNSASGYNIKSTPIALDRNEIAHLFLMSIPGPKMLWQFGEVGYDYSINENGRIGNKPIRWDYFQDSDRRDVYDAYAAINRLKTENDAWETDNFTLDVAGTGKRIHLNGSQTNAVVLGNFGVNNRDITADFQHTGWWFEYFSGDSINVTDVAISIGFEPGEYMVWTDAKLFASNRRPERNAKPEISVYPNPANNELTVVAKEPTLLSIYSLDGRLLHSQSIKKGQNKLFIEDLSSGTYLIKTTGNQTTFITKFVKQ